MTFWLPPAQDEESRVSVHRTRYYHDVPPAFCPGGKKAAEQTALHLVWRGDLNVLYMV